MRHLQGLADYPQANRMSDRELLELAAKAAGYALTDGSQGYRTFRCNGGVEWNPLDDDGDAFRLGVRLGLMVDCFECANDSVEASFDDGDFSAYCTEPVGEDKAAATRRAIVRVAAEIGKAME